jgi:hypothetical protein
MDAYARFVLDRVKTGARGPSQVADRGAAPAKSKRRQKGLAAAGT